MKLSVRTFLGMRPQVSADLLPAGEAQSATDVRLTAGELRPLLGLSAGLVTLSGAPQVKSIYRFGQSILSSTQFWFQATGDVDWVKGPVNEDTTERTYWTDGSFPKKTDSSLATSGTPYPSASYAMGVAAPASAPSVAVSGVATNPSDPGEAVVYVVTNVSVWGEESAPSSATAAVTWRAGQTINITSIPTAPGSGAHGENYNVTNKRLYRSATGSSNTQFQFVAQIAVATTTYNDTATTATLGDVLQTTGWLEPKFNMTGLCVGPNGILAGFFGNTVGFCVPFAPYAWPVRFEQSTDAPIVGLAWFDQTLFIGTTQGIYLCSGADPSTMTMTKLNVAQAPVSKRSIVAMQGGVYFASPDGLFRVDSTGISNVTDGLMTRSDWQLYVPSSISAYESDNRYVAFFDTGGRQGAMLFTFGAVPSFCESSVYAYAGFRDKKQDALFIVDVTNQVKKFDAGSALTYAWTSGVFHLESDENMGAALVDASAYPVTFKLYADGALKLTQTVTSSQAFRLPSGYRSRRYHFSLAGTANVREVAIGTTMADLAA